MTKKPSTSRIDIIDVFRLIFILFIMMLHFLQVFSDNVPGVRARSAWIFVEAFFILTGYFTTRHFRKSRKIKSDSIAKDALLYTFKKFSSFLPYVVAALVLGFIHTFMYRGYTFLSFIIEACKLPLELLFGSSFLIGDHCGPLWYLSALFIVFPFFCYLVGLNKYKYTRIIVFIFIAIIFLLTGSEETHYFPALFRASGSLVIGSLVYEMSDSISKKKFTKTKRISLQIFESFSFLFIIFIVMQHGNIIATYQQVRFCVLLAFFALFTLIFSKQTYSSRIQIPFANEIAALTLPLFLIHLNVCFIISSLNLDIPLIAIIFIYYLSSITIASILLWVVTRLKKH